MSQTAAPLNYASGPSVRRDGFGNICLAAVAVCFGAINFAAFRLPSWVPFRFSDDDVALFFFTAAFACAAAAYAYHRRSRRNPRALTGRGVAAFTASMLVPVLANYTVLVASHASYYSAQPPVAVQVLLLGVFLVSLWGAAYWMRRRRTRGERKRDGCACASEGTNKTGTYLV